MEITQPEAQKSFSEAQCKLLLQEKDLLLKELNHRVKNNLQVISSLLNMQARFVKNQQDAVLFEKCRDRVKSMALVHETLNISRTPGKIFFADYIQQLIIYLFSSYGYAKHDIVVKLEIQPVFFDTDTAIYCGLIINELLSNTLKYAFPSGAGGSISLKLNLHKRDEIHILVKDNGIGVETEVNSNQLPSLGLKLVDDLCHQLGGRFAIRNDHGTTALVVIKPHAGIEFLP